ncbi:MAG: hypothetical protein ACC742_11430 [Thermoanaerobaculales bacterium]
MFYFVDQILELDPGRHALGIKHVTPDDAFVRPVPGGAPVLLPCIIGEALGQLGAWSVMAAKDFVVRPVAGVVGEVSITGEAAVGDTVLLDTTIDSVTDDAVFYHAVASVNGTTVLRLEDTLGPLLPMEQFNDPEEMRGRLARLSNRVSGAVEARPPAADPATPFDLSFDEVLSMEGGKEATAVVQVSGRDAFYADHFPKKPVLPLSLLLESVLQLGQRVLEDGGENYLPTGARKVKMRRFVEPGSSLVVKVRVAERSAANALLKFRCEVDGGRVCVGEAEYAAASGKSR